MNIKPSPEVRIGDETIQSVSLGLNKKIKVRLNADRIEGLVHALAQETGATFGIVCADLEKKTDRDGFYHTTLRELSCNPCIWRYIDSDIVIDTADLERGPDYTHFRTQVKPDAGREM